MYSCSQAPKATKLNLPRANPWGESRVLGIQTAVLVFAVRIGMEHQNATKKSYPVRLVEQLVHNIVGKGDGLAAGQPTSDHVQPPVCVSATIAPQHPLKISFY